MTVEWVGSPNYDSNRKSIDRIVIHWFGSKDSTLKSTDGYFQNKGGTSAHYGIEDEKIHQYVAEVNVAYATGSYVMNQRSISIEHSANVNRSASDKTYETSSRLVAEIAHRHNIPLDRAHVIKHQEVVATSCPGTIDIDRIIRGALAISTPPMPILPTVLQHYSLQWKELAVDNGFDVNSKLFADYQAMDKFIADAKQAKDDAVRAVGLDPQNLKASLDQIIAKAVVDCQGPGDTWLVDFIAELWTSISTRKEKLLQIWADARKKSRGK